MNQSRTYQQPPNQNHQQHSGPSDGNHSDRSFLVSMLKDLKEELRKEISVIIKNNLNTPEHPPQSHSGQGNVLNYQNVPVVAHTQATYENYVPGAPTYTQTLPQWGQW